MSAFFMGKVGIATGNWSACVSFVGNVVAVYFNFLYEFWAFNFDD
ncbi:MAG: hypothetical protein RRY73_00810 [Alistipes sp.]